MFPFFDPPRHVTAERRRRFRATVALIALIVVAVLALQYTSHAFFPERKTSALWGVLTGVAVMTAFLEWRWSRAARTRA